MRGKKKKPETISREQWIAAGREVLIREGIDAVKVDRLAKKLGVTRGGFYWRFKGRENLLKALLNDWQKRNTEPLIRALSGPGTPTERYRAFQQMCIAEREYSPDFDTAIRAWAQVSPRVARVVHKIDDLRIEALHRLFLDASYNDDEAFIRARITYFHQVGYYAMGVRETKKRRYALGDLYYRVLTGFPIGQ